MITLKSAYEEFVKQSWSIFDSDIEAIEDDDAGVINTLSLALSDIWFSYDFSFKLKQKNIKTKYGVDKYNKPIGKISKIFLEEDNSEKELVENEKKSFSLGKPNYFYVKFNKLFFVDIPDNEYKIRIEYYNSLPVITENEESESNFSELSDRIDIPEEYEDLFLKALINKAMAIYPHPNSNINTSYAIRAKAAYERLLEESNGFKIKRVIKI